MPKFRLAQISAIEDLSPHLRRIVFAGDDLEDFPSDYESAHIKIVVPRQGEVVPNMSLGPALKRRMRSYTVRAFDAEHHLLTVDFAVNDHEGLIADWAANAKIGDYAGIGGPGPIKYTDLNADWHCFAGDLTALPAIAATLEKLPRDAVGYAFMQVPTDHDKQRIEAPENIAIKWLVEPDASSNALLEHVSEIEWLEGEPQIFIAGESSQIKAIHRLVKKNVAYQKSKSYASGYWKA